MLRIVSYRILFCFLVSAFCASPLAALQTAPWEGASFISDPTAIINAAAEIKTDKLYDAVSLLEQIDIRVDAKVAPPNAGVSFTASIQRGA